MVQCSAGECLDSFLWVFSNLIDTMILWRVLGPFCKNKERAAFLYSSESGRVTCCSISLCTTLVIRCSSLSMDDQERKTKTMADFTLNLVTASCSLALDSNTSQASSSLCALKAATNSTNWWLLKPFCSPFRKRPQTAILQQSSTTKDGLSYRD